MTGVNIKVRFGPSSNFIMRVRKVEVEEEAGDCDETDGESSGGFHEEDESGVATADVTFEGWVRRTDTGAPKRGDILQNVLIAWDGNVAQPDPDLRHLFPKLRVRRVRRTGGVREGSVAYTLVCRNSGPYKTMGEA